jgi:hypothetical protein
MYLACQPVSRPAHRLTSVPGNAGTVLMHATTEVSIICTAASSVAANAFMMWVETSARRRRTNQL